jgi:hypothetical protein
MDINPTEAESALAAIRETETHMRRAMNASGGGYQLIIWGVVLMIGYTLNQFADRLPLALIVGVWIVVSLVGNTVSTVINIRRTRKFHAPYSARLGAFWGIFILFGFVGAFFVHPAGPREINLLVYLMVMLGLAVTGLWVDLTLLWISLVFTGLMLFGYLVLPDFFFLWLAIVGGGAMIGSGLWLLRGGSGR